MPRARELLAIPVRRSTWQRFVYLGIGTALIAPFGTLAGFLAPVLEGGLGETAAWTVASVRVLRSAGRSLRGCWRPCAISRSPRCAGCSASSSLTLLRSHVPISWSTRWRSAGWFVAHLVAGGVIGALTLVLPPAAVSACLAPFASGDVQLGQLDATVPGGPASAWLVPLALLSPFALIYLVAAASAILARAGAAPARPVAGRAARRRAARRGAPGRAQPPRPRAARLRRPRAEHRHRAGRRRRARARRRSGVRSRGTDEHRDRPRATACATSITSSACCARTALPRALRHPPWLTCSGSSKARGRPASTSPPS